jgi:hypothetical protein
MGNEIEVIYKAAPGARITDDDARALGSTIKAMGPGVTAEKLLAEATKKRSPIHNLFEWDDKVAADGFRLDQARYFLRSVWEVKVDHDGREEGEGARAFYSVEVTDAAANKSKAYFDGRQVLEIPGGEEQVLERALKEAKEWQARYVRFGAHLADVFAAINATAARLTTTKKAKAKSKAKARGKSKRGGKKSPSKRARQPA